MFVLCLTAGLCLQIVDNRLGLVQRLGANGVALQLRGQLPTPAQVGAISL